MGDFAEILANIPEFKNPASRVSYVNMQGLEIVVISPLDGDPPVYLSSVTVQTTQGPMSVRFPIEGVHNIADACTAWQGCARAAVEDFGRKLKENQRRIVVPGSQAANSVPFKAIN